MLRAYRSQYTTRASEPENAPWSGETERNGYSGSFGIAKLKMANKSVFKQLTHRFFLYVFICYNTYNYYILKRCNHLLLFLRPNEVKHQQLETTPEISKRMANVSLKGGSAETALAKALWHRGIRYRKNYRKLPGSPDIAITTAKVAVFVDGEFWHGEDWENRKARLKSNREYWIEKIEENIARDKRNNKSLQKMGWIPIHFWEKEVIKHLDDCVETVLKAVNKQSQSAIDYEKIIDNNALEMLVAEEVSNEIRNE